MTPTIQAVGPRKRLSKTTALDELHLAPSLWGRSWPCPARPRTSDLGSAQDLHAPRAGHALHPGRHYTAERQGG
jgi:hypothetical protein